MVDPQTAARRRLATNARQTRERLALTQEVAAERIGCAVQVLQRLERAAAAVTIDLVASVATAYKVDIADLFKPTCPWQQPKPGRPRTAETRPGTRKRATGSRRR